uniref:Ig-like domain-containing protein n=1 Tax=Mola mola TaxID=94237 RepID=A0A3Q3VRG7_MOLML
MILLPSPASGLVLQKVQLSDAGIYYCVAKAGRDFDVLPLRLAVEESSVPPSGEQMGPPVTSTAGEPVILSCKASGSPVPQMSWLLPDGNVVRWGLAVSGGITIQSNGSLSLPYPSQSDAGYYRCIAVNQYGSDSRSMQLKLQSHHPPVLRTSFPRGPQEVRLDCQADGVPAPLLSWVLPDRSVLTSVASSNNRITMDTNGTLHISVTLPSDRGVYRCVASNSAGAASASVHIHVSSLPPVMQLPTEEHLLLSPGMPVYAHCSARGAPPPTLRWRIPDGTIVRPSQFLHDNLFVHPNGTLSIQVVSEKDAGDYLCITRNKVGDDYRLLRVSVASKPAKIEPNDDRSYYVVKSRQGETVTIPCQATGDPVPTVTWFSPTQRVIPRSSGSRLYPERVVVVSDGTLQVRLAQKLDTGNYTCRASNSEARSLHRGLGGGRSVPENTGLSEASHSEITQKPLQRGPSFPAAPRPLGPPSHPTGPLSEPEVKSRTAPLLSIINGETLRLSCPVSQAHGHAQGSPSWTTPSGKVLTRGESGESGRYKVQEDGTLTVQQATVFDRGTYTCRSTSFDSSLVSAITIPVIVIAYPPRITMGPSHVTYTRPGVAVELPCLTIATPRATVTWETPDMTRLKVMGQARIYGNRYLSPQGSLVIQNPTSRDTGFYRCTASNVIGVDTKTTYLHVI